MKSSVLADETERLFQRDTEHLRKRAIIHAFSTREWGVTWVRCDPDKGNSGNTSFPLTASEGNRQHFPPDF